MNESSSIHNINNEFKLLQMNKNDNKLSNKEGLNILSNSLKKDTVIIPSKVLYLNNLDADITESKIELFFSAFGKVDKVLILHRLNVPLTSTNANIHALIQMDSVENGINAYETIMKENDLIKLFSKEMTVSYSKNQELAQDNDPNNYGGRRYSNQINNRRIEPKRIILINIQNPQKQITTNIIYNIFNKHGNIEKIVIFVKPNGLQALVQYSDVEEAIRAKKSLNGRSLYADCCSLMINYSNLPELTVKENSLRTYDYQTPGLPIPEPDVPIDPLGRMPRLTKHRRITKDDVDIDESSQDTKSDENETTSDVKNTDKTKTSIILVSNLPRDATCDDLFNLFSIYGTISIIKKIKRNKENKKPTNAAFIQYFMHEDAVSAILHLRGYLLFGRSMEITFSIKNFISTNRPMSNNTDGLECKEYHLSWNRINKIRQDEIQKNKFISPTKSLYIANLSNNVTQETLVSHLKDLRNIRRLKIEMFRGNNNRQFALVELPNVEDAIDILATAHNTELDDRYIKVEFSKRTLSKNNNC